VLVWSDAEYGLIKWKQMIHFGRESHIRFTNPDFVRYAESFGAAGFRVESAGELSAVLQEALSHDGVSVIDCPVDYAENLKLTEKLGQLVCPI
jgi:acetolactate synthase-1/2/3 large subunit